MSRLRRLACRVLGHNMVFDGAKDWHVQPASYIGYGSTSWYRCVRCGHREVRGTRVYG